MDMEELNEVATLLHVTSEIAMNHPKLGAIQRACQQQLDEINYDLIQLEVTQAIEKNKAEAERQAANYKALQLHDPNYVESEKSPLLNKPIETSLDSNEIERRV